MSGPCLCGDPYCGRCGNPGLAEYEAAMDAVNEETEKAMQAGVRPDLIIAVVKALREGAEREKYEAEQSRLQNEAEAKADKEAAEYFASYLPESEYDRLTR